MHEEAQRHTTPVYQAAVSYAKFGWHVIPLKPRTKKSAIEWKNGEVNYQEEAPTADELVTWFIDYTVMMAGREIRYDEPVGIAAIVGAFVVHGDFDGDDDDGGYEEWCERYPITRTLPTVRTGSGRYHIFFRVEFPVRPANVGLPGGGRIQFRTGRSVAVLPPTVHPSGEPYRWTVDIPESGIPLVSPSSVGFSAKPRLTVVDREFYEGTTLTDDEMETIVASVSPHWKENYRHDLSMYVPGWLASIGVPEEDARSVISQLGAGEPQDMTEYQRSVATTYVAAENNEPYKGMSGLKDILTPPRIRHLEMIGKAHEPTFTMNPPLDPEGKAIPWIQSYEEFMAMEFPEPWWLVDGLIPGRDFGMVYGPGGSRKSWWLLKMGICVATGYDFLGQYVPDDMPVLYVQDEIGSYYLQERMKAIERALGVTSKAITRQFRTISNKGFRLDKDKDIQRMIEEDVKVRGTKLIMFDPFAALHHADENSAQEMTPIFNAMLRVREEYNLAMLLAHHPNKIDVLRGSSIMQAASDLIIRVTPDEKDDTKSVVKFEKTRNFRRRPPPHIFQVLSVGEEDVTFNWFDVEGAPAADSRDWQAEIRTAVGSLGEATLEDIAEFMGQPTDPLKKRLRDEVNLLLKAGVFSRVKAEGRKIKVKFRED